MLENIIYYILKVLPPELSHALVIRLLKYNPFPKKVILKKSLLQTKLFGFTLSNPIGLAAGFDKNGDALSGLLKMNFSFIEIGTVTPLPQKGNQKPRVHRLLKEESIINRLGFPNKGLLSVYKNLSSARKYHPLKSEPIIGVNIGCNKDSNDPVNDFVICYKKFYALADYITINISSPNTPGLRSLEQKEGLTKLLKKINNERAILEKKLKSKLPLALKISPDIKIKNLKNLIQIAIKYKIDGIIATNTTVNKKVFSNRINNLPAGGISGKPLFNKSNIVLKQVKLHSKNKLAIIGLGGVYNGRTAIEKLKLGATAIQLYSGLVFKGPSLIEKILFDISIQLKK